jgi:hypothetical protein
MLVQAIMFKLTELSFERCVPKPSTSLSGSERACIRATTLKYLETTQLVISGMGPLMQSQSPTD